MEVESSGGTEGDTINGEQSLRSEARGRSLFNGNNKFFGNYDWLNPGV